MIAEAFAVLWTLIHAALLWLMIAAVTVAVVVLTLAATVWWAWQTLRRGVRGPSWARGRRGAREYARSRARRPDGRTAPPMPRPGVQAARTAPHSPSRGSRHRHPSQAVRRAHTDTSRQPHPQPTGRRMTDQPAARVRFARRFVATIPCQPDIHGVEFPSGHVIADTQTGLTAFLTVDVITSDYDGAVIHWADRDQP